MKRPLLPFVCLVAGTLLAQTNAPVVIVVEANRLRQTQDETPFFSEVISRAAIQQAGARDAVSLLARKTTVQVRQGGGGNPALAQLSLRGYGAYSFGRVLVRADGEVLNRPDLSAPDLSRLPLGSLSQIEVLHGPQTVLYGDAASAGVVNFTTQPPDYTRQTSLEVSGGNWNTLGAALTTKGGDRTNAVSYRAAADWKHSDGYRSNSGYDFWNVSAAVRKDFERGSFTRLNTFWSDTDYDVAGALDRDTFHNHPRVAAAGQEGYWYRTRNYGLSLAGHGVLPDDQALDLNAAFSTRHARSWMGGTYESDIYSYVLTPQYTRTDCVRGFQNDFRLGADTRFDVMRGDSYGTKLDQHKYAMAAFSRDEFFLTDELSLAAGTRLARYFTRNERVSKPARTDNLAAFEAELLWRPVERVKTFIRWTEHFRTPSLDEYAFNAAWQPTEILKPERGWTTEAGGDWLHESGFLLGGTLFVSEVKDEIMESPWVWWGSNCNAPETIRREGLELKTGWEREKVGSLLLRYTGVLAQFAEGTYRDNDVPLVPRHTISLDGSWYLLESFALRGGYRFESRQYLQGDWSNDAPPLKDFGLFTLGFLYEPTWKWAEGFSLTADVDNLFDKNYADYGSACSGCDSYYPAAGRTFFLRARYAF